MSPISSNSQIDKFCPDIKEIVFPTSNPLPPPNAITPSFLLVLKIFTPSLTLLPVGFPTTFENILGLIPSASNLETVSKIILFLARPLSVTIKGFFIFN